MKIEFSNDPITKTKQKKKLKRKWIAGILMSIVSLFMIVGLVLIIIGTETRNFALTLSGCIIGCVGLVSLIIIDIIYFSFFM